MKLASLKPLPQTPISSTASTPVIRIAQRIGRARAAQPAANVLSVFLRKGNGKQQQCACRQYAGIHRAHAELLQRFHA